MKRKSYCTLLGLMILILAACDALPIELTPVPPPATITPPPPTATIDWFPVSETPTTQPVPTFGPTPERKPGIGKLLLTDKFVSKGPWSPGASEEASIDVSRGRLTIAVQPGVNAFRLRQGPALTNFYAEVTARPSLCRDGDEYGLLLRAPNNIAYYSFALACNGTSRVERVRVGKPSTPLQPPTPSADAPPGAPGEVRLGVWVSGPLMRFFLNGHYQYEVNDAIYPSGALGIFARSVGSTPVTVTFSDLAIYSVTYTAPTATATP